MLRFYHRAAAQIDLCVIRRLEMSVGCINVQHGLNRMIFFSERSLRKATREYAAHYHRERNHQGLDNRLIEPYDRPESMSNAIKCVQRLGGMLRFYHRAAAQVDLRATL